MNSTAVILSPSDDEEVEELLPPVAVVVSTLENVTISYALREVFAGDSNAVAVKVMVVKYNKKVEMKKKKKLECTFPLFLLTDERFFFFQQRTVQHGRTCSLALIRTGVRKKGVVPPVEVMTGIGLEVEPFTEPWVDEWNAWDDARPWPED